MYSPASATPTRCNTRDPPTVHTPLLPVKAVAPLYHLQKGLSGVCEVGGGCDWATQGKVTRAPASATTRLDRSCILGGTVPWGSGRRSVVRWW
ncbi:hypothetical protein E2C01_102781 [Portunus trituberculatus]|uniref:Uncharacterized protein n=1 Tax=Portunus trituberculatus TaxID=210409 RepID=A0A5B7KJ62_PORTR|nr:hypothetical protein [Portunus trituberculatus]